VTASRAIGSFYEEERAVTDLRKYRDMFKLKAKSADGEPLWAGRCRVRGSARR
jgi:hypothetical protein